jgi:hypothetical protein
MMLDCAAHYAKTLSDEEKSYWSKFLPKFSIAELRYAFATYQDTKTIYFPKPAEIQSLCESFRSLEIKRRSPVGCHRCNWTGFYFVSGGKTDAGNRAPATEPLALECPCKKNVALREQLPVDENYCKGYGEGDMKWLLKRMEKIYAAGDTPDSEALLTELDGKRPDGAPAWRR